MENKLICISGCDKTLTSMESSKLLKDKDWHLLKFFPGLKAGEKGCNCDELSTKAAKPAIKAFSAACNGEVTGKSSDREHVDFDAIKRAYQKTEGEYERYSPRHI